MSYQALYCSHTGSTREGQTRVRQGSRELSHCPQWPGNFNYFLNSLSTHHPVSRTSTHHPVSRSSSQPTSSPQTLSEGLHQNEGENVEMEGRGSRKQISGREARGIPRVTSERSLMLTSSEILHQVTEAKGTHRVSVAEMAGCWLDQRETQARLE